MYNHYLEQLEGRYKSLWDVKRDVVINEWKVDLLSKFVARYERYVLTKKAKIGSAQTDIYDIVITAPQELTLKELHKLEQVGKDFIGVEVIPSFEHMCTEVRLVLIGAGYTEDVIKYAKKYSYAKNYLWGLKGWTTLIFILVDVKNGVVYAHPGLKDKDREIYMPSLEMRERRSLILEGV